MESVIDKTNILAVVEERLARLAPGHGLEIRTYKRNRRVLLVPLADGTVRVVEDGYAQSDATIPAARLRKILKTLVKREFPRSTKLRLYTLGPDEIARGPLPRKTI